MPDIFDDASATEALFLAAELAAHQRVAAAAVVQPTGRCHSCGAPIEHGRFCDSYCRDDHERLQAAKVRNGASS
jgi:hypothetical protein